MTGPPLTAAYQATYDDQPQRPFAQRSWTVQTYGSAALGGSSGRMYSGHIGFGFHIFDNVSINLEGLGGWVDSRTDDDGGAGGFDLLARWHFISEEDFSIYIDGGFGLQQATTNFPDDNHFNFRPQLGLGATVRIIDDVRLMGGARWLHISNAGISDSNNGFDGVQVYAGLMLHF